MKVAYILKRHYKEHFGMMVTYIAKRHYMEMEHNYYNIFIHTFYFTIKW